jgi:uncharacterized membrane protein
MFHGDEIRALPAKLTAFFATLFMQRFWEILLGLRKGFLGQEGHFSIQFNPSWPWQDSVGGAGVWNLLLFAAAAALVVYVYRREGRSQRARIILGSIRAALLVFLLILLNRPVLTLGQIRREPSVLGILIDDSLSMEIPDATGADGKPEARLSAAVNLLTDQDGKLLRKLASMHAIRIFDFSRGAHQIASVDGPDDSGETKNSEGSIQQAISALRDLQPVGEQTQVVSSLRSVLEELQGQRVAGVVLLTDGRETPSAALPEAVDAVHSFGVNIVPVPVGSDRMPRNVVVESVSYEPSGFVDDITNFKVTLRATGFEPNHPIVLALKREITQDGRTIRVPVLNDFGRPITTTVYAADDRPFDAELQYKPTAADMPTAHLIVEAEKEEGELPDTENFRKVQLAVLDDKITLLYVDGYPRWDYRYLKNAMLRDKTVKISCLLTSADPTFRQEGSDDPSREGGSWAITAFPTSMDQLQDYDVVILGDVDPRQFTDEQLQMISDFVSKKGGGFAMVAGPRWSPQAFRNTPIEPVLPVIISHVETDDSDSEITEGFRPVLTKAGTESSIFRFFADEAANQEYLKNHLQELFWYCRGLIVKPGVGIVLAEHPSDLGPDNRKAPIFVIGRFGAGRTIFSAIDDSWRWRFYTGESIFNTYWVQQLRYLARGRKLGERKLTFTSEQDSYELGKQVRLQVRLLSADLMQQTSGPITAQIVDDSTGTAVRQVELNRLAKSPDELEGSFTADRAGQFSAKLPELGGVEESVSYNVQVPQLELDEPQVDLPALSRLAAEAPLPLSAAAAKLPGLLPSAAKIIPIDSSQPLWNAPLAMLIFAVLILSEWIIRKMLGML